VYNMPRRLRKSPYSQIRVKSLRQLIYLREQLRKRNINWVLEPREKMIDTIVEILGVSERTARDYLYTLLLLL